MNQNQNTPLQKLKTFGVYATIAMLIVSAIIAIFMIFFGTERTLLQVLATMAILYLTTLLCANNASQFESPYTVTRVLSIVALIINIFWSLPWILIVWGCFDYGTADIVWRLVWTALSLSVYCTVMSTALPAVIYNFKGYQRVQQFIPMMLVSYIFLNVIVAIWTFDYTSTYDLIMRLIAAEAILLVVQWAVPEILIRNQRRQMTTLQMPNPDNQVNHQSSNPSAQNSAKPNIKNSGKAENH